MPHFMPTSPQWPKSTRGGPYPSSRGDSDIMGCAARHVLSNSIRLCANETFEPRDGRCADTPFRHVRSRHTLFDAQHFQSIARIHPVHTSASGISKIMEP